MLALGAVVIGLFVSGAVWRATHPNASENPTDNPTEEQDIAARQDGYYLCLHRQPMTAAQMYRLVKRKLPHDDVALALRGCQEAQPGSGG
jgi:hypothetical protein